MCEETEDGKDGAWEMTIGERKGRSGRRIGNRYRERRSRGHVCERLK